MENKKENVENVSDASQVEEAKQEERVEGATQTQQVEQPTQPMQQQAEQSTRMRGIVDLFEATWELFSKNFKNIALILSVNAVVATIAALALQGLGFSPEVQEMMEIPTPLFAVPPIVSFVLWILSMYVGVISFVALIISIRDGSDFEESYRKAIEISGPVIVVFLLMYAVMIGGMMLLFIPGLIFSVLVSMSLYALVFENRKGMDALFRSVDLVKGNFWAIVGRLCVLMLAMIPVGMIFGLISLPLMFLSLKFQYFQAIQVLVQQIISGVIYGGFGLMFSLVMYRDLKMIRKEEDYERNEERKKNYLYVFVVLGAIVLVAMLGFIAFMLFGGVEYFLSNFADPSMNSYK